MLKPNLPPQMLVPGAYVKMGRLFGPLGQKSFMQITHLSLTNFRNYGRLELDLPSGPVLLHGANAQGKTNLLEAFYYLATSRSPHADQDQQLINWQALNPDEPIIASRLLAQIQTKRGLRHIEMRLVKEQFRDRISFRREALVNRRKVRLMDLLGNLQVVLFLPEDVQIVTGSPSKRRRYLDITLCQSDRAYCRNLSTYNKVLEQRNALLRQIAEQGTGNDVLPVFTEKLVRHGSQIFIQRAAFMADLAREAQHIHYEQLTDGRETLRLDYLPRLLNGNFNRTDDADTKKAIELGQWLQQANLEETSSRFGRLLEESRSAEVAAGMTKVGPHRDDWQFRVNGRSLSSFGSRGQQRSALLSLKLAEIRWMSDKTGEAPVLLLDEVLAELDEHRRDLLLATVERVNQAILTATDPGMFNPSFLKKATLMTITEGRVILDNHDHDLTENNG